MDFSLLNEKKFSEMCNQLIKAEYPNSNPVEGSGGDEGIDSFIGDFDGLIKIFQYKFFLKPIRNPQQNQIKQSLLTAKEKHSLTEWVLVIPRNFTPREIRLFNQLQRDNPTIKIDYIGATELRNLLNKHISIKDSYFKEDKLTKEIKSNSQKLNEIFNLFKEEISIGNLYTSGWNVKQINICKFDLININLEDLISNLNKNYQYAKFRKLGFTKFNKINDTFYKTRFILKEGKILFKMLPKDLKDDPFELKYPNYKDAEIWIKDVSNKNLSIISVCIFNSTKPFVDLIKKIFKDCVLSDSVIIKDLEFNKDMKSLVNKSFSSSIDTLQIEPNIIQKAKQDSGQEIDVKIIKDTIYGDQGLPKTKFVKNVMKYVKPIKEKGVSDIIYFKARQSSKLDNGKQITFELHNDGRVRFWLPKKEYNNDKELMKKMVNEFLDKLHKKQ